MVKESMCSNSLCKYLGEVGMPIGARTGWFGKVRYECSLAQAMKWFREKHNIHIDIHLCSNGTWSPELVGDYSANGDKRVYFYTYEEAADFGLWLAIKNIGGEIHIEYD